MHKIRFILLLALSVSIIQIVHSQEHDFRDVDWGMSKEDVQKAVTGTPCETPAEDLRQDCLCFAETLGGVPYDLYYCFKNDKLESAFYTRNESTYSKGSLADLFYSLKIVLEKKYGTDYFMVLKEGAGWGEYTMLVDSKKDLENLIRLDEFLVRLVWKKSDRTHVSLELQSMKTSQLRNGRIAVRYEPSARSVLFDDKSFGKKDYEKL